MHCWGRNDVYIYKVSGTRILWYSITVFYVMMKKNQKKKEEFCAVIDCFCRKERAESCLFDYCCLSQIPQISMLPVASLNCERSVLQQCAFSREPIQDLSRLPISSLTSFPCLFNSKYFSWPFSLQLLATNCRENLDLWLLLTTDMM